MEKTSARTGTIAPRFDSPRHAVFTIARHKCAWPGGYALVAVMSDGDCLCHDCVKENVAQIVRATRNPDFRTGWEYSGFATVGNDFEPDGETCAHCYRDLSTL